MSAAINRELLSAAGFDVGWKLVRALPEPIARVAFARAADLATWRDGPGVRQLRRNLARVVEPPELQQTVAAAMRSYARYWMETFRLPSLDHDAVLANTETEGSDLLDEALKAGRGVVLALPHSGNWEVAGLWLVRRGFPFATVAERLRPESLYDRFVAYRESLGMQVLPLSGGATSTTRALLQRLRAGGVVCLVADRDLSRRGVEVGFFGERTRMPAGPAQLALATGAALLPVHTYYGSQGGWRQWIGNPVSLDEHAGAGDHGTRIAAAIQSLADTFQARIAAHPADWHMLQPLWLADLAPRPVS